MTQKKDLIKTIAIKSGITPNQAEKVLDTFFKETADHLKKGHSLVVSGFGTFSTVKMAPQVGTNLRTEKTVISSVKMASQVGRKPRTGKTVISSPIILNKAKAKVSGSLRTGKANNAFSETTVIFQASKGLRVSLMKK